MTKDDLIWVVIRGAGLVLLILAILEIPEFLGAITWSYYLGDVGGDSTETARMFIAGRRSQFVMSLTHFSVYGALGIYLLRRGAWLHRLLRHVTPERSNTTPHADAPDVPASSSDSGARAGGRER